MVHETIEGTFRQTNLSNESAKYLAKREELRLAEIELMHQRERVAELRRHLPPGPALEDYKFIEGPDDLVSGDTQTRTVRLSELFTAAGRPLVIYHLMYGKRQTKPCPMCTAWIDGINGVAHHIAQKRRLHDCGRSRSGGLASARPRRGWNRLHLLSAGDSTFKYDLGREDREGNQDSTISVFTRDGHGAVHHFYTA